MSRDKYSDDHTVTVNEGAGTFTVDGNLSITGAFDLDKVSFTSAIPQRLRFLGNAFRPDDGDDANIIYHISRGAIQFTGTAAYANVPLPGIPHGATIASLRIVGIAEGASDTITVDLLEANGATSSSLDSITIANQGLGVIDITSNLGTPKLVDYTLDKAYHLRVFGQAGSATAEIHFVDIIYTVQSFPQSSETTPS